MEQSVNKVIWQKDQVKFLKQWWGSIPIDKISKNIGINSEAIIRKAYKLKLGGMYQLDYYFTPNQLKDILYTNAKTIVNWIENYGLKCKKNKILNKRKIYRIEQNVLIKWLEDNKDKWDASKVQEYALGVEPEWLRKKRKKDIEKHKRCTFTEYEKIQVIKLHNQKYTQKQICRILKKNKKPLQTLITTLIQQNKILSNAKEIYGTLDEKELKIFIEMDKQNKGDKEIGVKLNRPRYNIEKIRKDLIKKNLYPAKSKYELVLSARKEKIKEYMKQNKTKTEICSLLNIHRTTLNRNLQKFRKEDII